jgi:hypothetical protein
VQAVQWAIQEAVQANAGTDRNTAVVQLTGLLHGEERCALKYIARQLCSAFSLEFVSGASFDDNLKFLKGVLRNVSKCEPPSDVDVYVLPRDRMTRVMMVMCASLPRPTCRCSRFDVYW